MNEREAKEAILDIGKRMYEREMVAGNDGNISVRLDDGRIVCTPTMVSKGFIKEEELCVLDSAGNKLSGTLEPTSEIKMHLGIYDENPEVKAVVHAHPVTATSFAAAGMSLTDTVLAEAVSEPGPAPLAPFAEPGSTGVPESVRPFCRDYKACLLEKHGALTWGKDPYEAFYRMEKLEHNAKIFVMTKCLTAVKGMIR